MPESKKTLSITFVFFLAWTSISGQCVREPLTANGFRGRVVSEWGEPKKEMPLVDATVRLLKRGRAEMETVVEVKTALDETFSFDAVKSGDYTLDAYFPGLARFVTRLRIRSSRHSKSEDRVIINLAPPSSGTDSCEGSAKILSQ